MSHFSEQTAERLASWRRDIPSICDLLRGLSSGSEEEFLSVGEVLQGVYGQSLALTQRCREMLELLSGAEFSRIEDQLQVMLDDMERYVSVAQGRNERGRESLRRERELLCRVAAPLEGFGKLNKTLRMLSISTKIESARLGAAGAGFVNLAMDVERLSHEVSVKSESIREDTLRLLLLIDESLVTLGSDTALQERDAGHLVETIRANLSSLGDLHRRFISAGETVLGVSDEVSAAMGEVVSALQFHDITRQQMEHVIEALEKIPGRIDEAAASAGETATDLVVEIGDVCELQQAQLRHAVDELCSAVDGVRSALTGIGSRVGYMVAQLQDVTGMAEHEGEKTLVERVMEGMQGAAGFLLDCRRLDREMGETLRRVSETIVHITGFVSEIRRIGSEIDLIALNSQIRAVHAGTDGAALAVLAEAIKRLSDDAVIQTTELSRLLGEIEKYTNSLDDREGGAEGESFIDDAERRLDEALGHLSALDARIISSLRGLRDDVHSLDDDITSVTRRFRIDERVRTVTEPLFEALHRIIGESRAIHPASERFLDSLRSMEKRYTMESERRIHEDVIRRRQAPNMSVPGSASRAFSSVSGSAGEFGDNVELF